MTPTICRMCERPLRPPGLNPNICAACDGIDQPVPEPITIHHIIAWSRRASAGNKDVASALTAKILAEVLQNPGSLAACRARILECRS